MPRLIPLILLAGLASCGASNHSASNHSTRDPDGGPTVDNSTLAKLTLTSDAFKDGQAIPAQYSCDGAGRTPMLRWDEPPPATRSFALVVDDPDAPGGTFHHWGVFDIPATARSIGDTGKTGSEVANDFGKPGYGGPCPPKGHGPHHYHFKLFALDTEKLALPTGAKIVDLEKAARKHALAQGELVGTYERP